ncbi:NAD(P)/FAD-dependent oxidoreductase [Inhella sp.]|uniref:NAD(P)/FAD-dependent oxidoreductase n=1 Tax=Inhella sp. TaxID=1921806 RepID=UPI0035AFBEF2
MKPALRRVAIVGAGIAGATLARRLTDVGIGVQVFEKSRGLGGRLATRRTDWTAPDGRLHRARFDHGAPAFAAHTPAFRRFMEQAQRAGRVTVWSPRQAPTLGTVQVSASLWLPTPDMPALCRHLLEGLDLQTGCTIDALRRGPGGWSLQAAGACAGDGFDAVVLAMPAPQAAVLLHPYQLAWAERAARVVWQPCWVLMGVAEAADAAPDWDMGRPSAGPLSCVLRTDARPGRERIAGLTHWVAHATPAWSQQHLEEAPFEVQAALLNALQSALAEWQVHVTAWRHVAVHRWRYASALGPADPAVALDRDSTHWWHEATGIGACGDAVGDALGDPLAGAGVERAWCSATALAAHMMGGQPGQPAP